MKKFHQKIFLFSEKTLIIYKDIFFGDLAMTEINILDFMMKIYLKHKFYKNIIIYFSKVHIKQ